MTLYAADDLSNWNSKFPSGAVINKIGPDVDNLIDVDWVANGGVYVWDTVIGDVRIYENGNIDPPEYDDGGSTQGHPANGIAVANGELFLTKVYNGIESTIRLTISLIGYDAAPPPDPAPTSISPVSITINEIQPTGSTFATLSANAPNCTFSEILDASNKFSISSLGALQLTSSLTAAGSPYSFTARATNGTGSFDQIVTINALPDPGSGSLVADVDAATASAVTSTLASWESNWAGTVPSGKTAADRRYIRLTAPISTLTIDGYDFSAVAGVTIFAAGPYTIGSTWPYLPTTTANITTQLAVRNSKNIRLTRIRARDPRFDTVTNSDITIDRNVFHGDTTVYGAQPTNVQQRQIKGTNYIIKDNYWFGFLYSAFTLINTTNCLVEGNIFEYTTGDSLTGGNATSTETNLKIKRNWLFREPALTAGSHADGMQLAFGVINGGEIWGNVFFRRSTGFGNIQTSGCIYTSDGMVTYNTAISNNILVTNNVGGININGGSGNTATYNTLIRINNGAVGTTQQSWIPTVAGVPNPDYNYINVKSSGIDGGQGPNGIKTVIGNTDNAIPFWTNHLNYFDLEPTDLGDIRHIKPKSGAACHWAFGGTKVGAWERFKEIYSDGIIPANVGWPLAEVWTRLWDSTRSISSTYTGNYDADGNNV